MHVFYTPDISGSDYILNEEESRHCMKVLRLSTGQLVHLIDGKGGLYEAEITAQTKRNVILRVVNHVQDYQKRNYSLHIAVAPTKNIDRLEWFLEKATEIGIDEVTPLICERSERKIVKDERLNKVITAAVKQSLQAFHPQLNAAATFKELIDAQSSLNGFKMIAHCLPGEEKQFIQQVAVPGGNYLILIGPEGDFSPQEIEMALAAGYKALSLGETRLRTETAALAACFEASYINR
ncbi:16S rRNA (uracil(1498)-N(3))-methyltransferase [Pedobacter antarcticus]|uniref:Ribosomal RNA small subunit methyltransferase E n=2 Tax=Pedobacter antarcticus TaxID=34086 RepID=A0A081PFP2_9SPHI|nr:16S rRNA (uracil(1498)-N(3))-methyltransferase [Pedobacter antarcticus]KEQ29515.1 16S rRNA methyltransferase [Pedobacter antarcticus 4BY]SDM20024.1 16S rRNA (uracil1498-N3)-methyltransferase [Pedobacter antarcticus]SFF10775.1 16S rRNA (uracil1498-N3)-methyltransferase [Pedobacter antarcticus]